MSGTWMLTHKLHKVDPFNAKVEDIDIEDIAHALGNICRFTGHTREFYSVAQHCVHVAERVRSVLTADLIRGGGYNIDWVLHALLHDAHEAYLNDLSAPIKRQPSSEPYCAACDELQTVVEDAFELPMRTEQLQQLITKADLDMCYLEGLQLIGDPTDWGIPRPDWYMRIHPWPPNKARFEFLKLFRQLRGEW